MMIINTVGIGILASISAIYSGDGEFPMDILTITIIIIHIDTMVGIIHTPITMVGMIPIHTMDIMATIIMGITMDTIMAIITTILITGIRTMDTETPGIRIPITIRVDLPIIL
jgi:hypothetical protein